MSDDGPPLMPGAAAKELDVSASGLRRLASIYESVHGKLERAHDGDRAPILWPPIALRRLEAARQLHQKRRAASIEDALQRLRDTPDTLTNLEDELSPEGAPGVLLEELRALRSEVRDLRDELGRIRGELPSSTSIDTAPAEGEIPEWVRWLVDRYNRLLK